MTHTITRAAAHGRAAALALIGAGLIALMAVPADMRQSLLAPKTMSFLLLCLVLTVAFGFEVVNGFHDTANAAAMAIYTH
jgi:hypothetical protein